MATVQARESEVEQDKKKKRLPELKSKDVHVVKRCMMTASVFLEIHRVHIQLNTIQHIAEWGRTKCTIRKASPTLHRNCLQI